MLRRDLRIAFADGEGLRRLHEALQPVGEFLEIHGTLSLFKRRLTATGPDGRTNPAERQPIAANIGLPLNGDIARGLAKENASVNRRALTRGLVRLRDVESLELADGIRGAFVGLGSVVGLIGTVGVPTLPFAAIGTAASILSRPPPWCSRLPSMALAVLPAAALALPVMPAAAACLANVAATAIGTIVVRSPSPSGRPGSIAAGIRHCRLRRAGRHAAGRTATAPP